ncbi:MAG: GNAT family N-acetyltransferase [Planctomycetota bacterium]|nr:GNAT family N-acetyltransferase [Planctomycetota bacterium]
MRSRRAITVTGACRKSRRPARRAQRSPAVRVRRAVPGDVALLCELSESYNNVIRRHARGKAATQLLGSERRFFERAVLGREKDTMVLVADCAGRGVGFVFATVERTADDLVPAPYIDIALLAVADSHRRRGVASKLVREVHREARSRRIVNVVLAAHEFNKGALAFYARLGYKTIMRKLRKRLR